MSRQLIARRDFLTLPLALLLSPPARAYAAVVAHSAPYRVDVSLLYGALTRGAYRNWLLFGAGFALVVTIGVSGSRSVLLAVLVVVASLLLVIVLQPRAVNQFGRNLLIVVTVLLIAVRLPIFNEGVKVLSDRFTSTAEAEETTIAGGLIARTLSGFTEGFVLLGRAPIGGYGLGIGTNGGAKFLTGRTLFLLSEGGIQARTVDAHRLRQIARTAAHLVRRQAAAAPPQHRLDAVERLERANQHRRRRALRFGDGVHQPVHAVVEIHVRRARRMLRDKGPRTRARPRVARLVVHRRVGFRLHHDARATAPHERAADEFPRACNRVARKKVPRHIHRPVG